jgi:hypothetical protein
MQAMISPSTPFPYHAHLVHLATSTSNELFRDSLHREACYHYNLALRKIAKMQEERDKHNYDHQQVETIDCQEMLAKPRHLCLAQLGEPVIL